MSVAELVHETAQRHTEPMGDPVPGVQRTTRRAVLQVDQHRPGQPGELRELVVGEPLLGPQPGQFVPQRLMVGLGSTGHPHRLAVNEP